MRAGSVAADSANHHPGASASRRSACGPPKDQTKDRISTQRHGVGPGGRTPRGPKTPFSLKKLTEQCCHRLGGRLDDSGWAGVPLPDSDASLARQAVVSKL